MSYLGVTAKFLMLLVITLQREVTSLLGPSESPPIPTVMKINLTAKRSSCNEEVGVLHTAALIIAPCYYLPENSGVLPAVL